MYDLANFVARLYEPDQPSVVKHVRIISLNLPNDSMALSGILDYLDGKDHP
jgi:hypothetical protein